MAAKVIQAMTLQNIKVANLLEALELESSVAGLVELAQLLSSINGRGKNWSWRYIHQIAHGKLDPSKAMISAMDRLGAQLDGVPKLRVLGHQINVWSLDPESSNAMIPTLTSKRCMKCSTKFVPNVRCRKYCFICRPIRTRGP